MTIDTRADTGTRGGRVRVAGSSRDQRATPPSTPQAHVSHAPTTLIRAGVVETEASERLDLERVSPSLLRVTLDGRTLGFVEHVGRVYVALSGDYYDRAVEVAQTLDVARAARALA